MSSARAASVATEDNAETSAVKNSSCSGGRSSAHFRKTIPSLEGRKPRKAIRILHRGDIDVKKLQRPTDSALHQPDTSSKSSASIQITFAPPKKDFCQLGPAKKKKRETAQAFFFFFFGNAGLEKIEPFSHPLLPRVMNEDYIWV